jgi:hypothetical protein
MGVERLVKLPSGSPAEWPAIRSFLVRAGESPSLRMIDGELSFPDEEPAAGWSELRVALAGGMVTLRRTTDGLACITWGNADAALLRSWNVLAWAVASSADGTIDGDTPAEFARRQQFTAG